MARRNDGLIEWAFEFTSKLPWWLSFSLAILSYSILQSLASSGSVPVLVPGTLGAGTVSHFGHTFAYIGQFVLPVIFSVGGLVSLGSELRGKQLLSRVRKTPSRCTLEGMRWREFELMVMEWFRRQGFAVRDTELGADGGVDMVLSRDGGIYLVQCKQWRAFKVGVNIVRELRGVMSVRGAEGGFVVTSGVFTGDARRFARDANITLIDGAGLTKVLQQHQKDGQAHRDIIEEQLHPKCPRCGSEMVERKASRGPHAGSYFWGCSRYPACRGTLPSKK